MYILIYNVANQHIVINSMLYYLCPSLDVRFIEFGEVASIFFLDFQKSCMKKSYLKYFVKQYCWNMFHNSILKLFLISLWQFDY